MEQLNPEDFISEWKDHERINFLYSAFPADKNVNLHHFESKLSYWKKTVISIVSSDAYKKCYFQWNEFANFVNKDNRQPLGLDTVFDDMSTSGEIVLLKNYLQDLEANGTWYGWGLNQMVKKPSKWMLGKVLSPLKTRNTQQKFVVPEAITTKAQKLLKKIHNSDILLNTDEHHYANMNIFEYSELLSMSADICDDSQSLDVVLALLKFQGKITIHIQECKAEKCRRFVKFVRENEDKVEAMNEVNIGCVELYQNKERLESSIHLIYKEMDDLVVKAKQLSKENKKGLALNALRKKKRLQATIEKKEIALSNIEKLLDSIVQCKTDKLIMNTYTTGVKAYHDLMDQEGMSLEIAEKTKSDLEEVFDLQEDISNAISSPISKVHDDDDDSLEDEFNKLLLPEPPEVELEDALQALTICDIQKEFVDDISNQLPDVPAVPPTHKETNKIIPKPTLLAS